MSPLSFPELIQSTDSRVWAAHRGFSSTAQELTPYIEAIRAQGFRRLRWDEGAKRDCFINLPGTPFQRIATVCPPRQLTSSMDLLALTLVEGDGSILKVGVGFLRYNDRWYFSTTGDNFEHVLSSATIWRNVRRVGSPNER